MKTYMSILYFNNGIKERINVGLIMFNDNKCLVNVSQNKLKFVKKFKPEAFPILKSSACSFKKHYDKNIPTHKEITRYSIYHNGVFKLDAPSFIAVELNEENFNNFFDKHI